MGVEVGPVKSGDTVLKIDTQKSLKIISAIVGLCFGPKGIPNLISNIGDIPKIIKKEIPINKRVQGQGFVLLSLTITQSIIKILQENAPWTINERDSPAEISAMVHGALCSGEITITRRFFITPGLNSAFIRVKDRLQSVLSQPSLKLDPGKSEILASKLGSTFSQSLYEIIENPAGKDAFSDLLSVFGDNPFQQAADRSWQWDQYRSEINKQVFRRLFLHELDGHPDISIADLYVDSRATYLETIEKIEDKIHDSDRIVNAVELKSFLLTEWLNKETRKVGHSRLVTGDPGAGKSTFSLMLSKAMLDDGWRVLFIPANSIRSLGLSFQKILETHFQRTLKSEVSININQELTDPDSTGKPLLIILDGLDEYDVGGGTVSLAAAKLVDHVMTVMDEWVYHGHAVRLLLCGRPEAAAALTRFREVGHHLHVTGFVAKLAPGEKIANDRARKFLDIDQREEWWKKWQALSGIKQRGLPNAIKMGGEGVLEITAQPLLNYMLAVLKLYEPDNLTNLSSLYGELFSRYYQRQSDGKSGTFEKICPSLDRFRRVMSEIGIAAWHAGDRSVSTEDLQSRFDKPPLKSWFERAGATNSGLGAILSAFYTRPEDAASPESGLAQRYVFTHKSFREYLTGVGVVRFLQRLAEQLDPETEDGWSDYESLREWLILFGPTGLDTRQWQFIMTELETQFCGKLHEFILVKKAVEKILALSLRRQMPVLSGSADLGTVLSKIGNAEEAIIGILNAIRLCKANINEEFIDVNWPKVDNDIMTEDEYNPMSYALMEFLHRIRSRPGCPDEFVNNNIGCLFEKGGLGLNEQIKTKFRRRSDGWDYAKYFDFTGMNVGAANFRNVDLVFSRFHRATASGADFSYSIMNEADFGHFSVNLDAKPVNFSGSSARNSRMHYVTATHVIWEDVDLSGADLRGQDADLFERAKLNGSIFGDLGFRTADEDEDDDQDENDGVDRDLKEIGLGFEIDDEAPF